MTGRILRPLRSRSGGIGASTVRRPYEALTAGWRSPAPLPVMRKLARRQQASQSFQHSWYLSSKGTSAKTPFERLPCRAVSAEDKSPRRGSFSSLTSANILSLKMHECSSQSTGTINISFPSRQDASNELPARWYILPWSACPQSAVRDRSWSRGSLDSRGMRGPLVGLRGLMVPGRRGRTIGDGARTGVASLLTVEGEGGGLVSLYRVTTVTTWTNTDNEQHTDGKWRKRETEIKREDGGWMNTGPSAESGDDDVPVCPLRRWWQSWQAAGWQALPGGSGTEYRSDTPPRHQALLPGRQLLISCIWVGGHGQRIVVKEGHKDPKRLLRLRLIIVGGRAAIPIPVVILNRLKTTDSIILHHYNEQPFWHFCCHAVVLETGLQAHTMGRPGAAHVPAGRPRPVPSYFAIVYILGDGVSLTVILRGYLYRKHQLEGDGPPAHTDQWRGPLEVVSEAGNCHDEFFGQSPDHDGLQQEISAKNCTLGVLCELRRRPSSSCISEYSSSSSSSMMSDRVMLVKRTTLFSVSALPPVTLKTFMKSEKFSSDLATFCCHPLRCFSGDGFSHRVRDECASRLWKNPLGGGGAWIGRRRGLKGVALHGHRRLGRGRACGVPARLARRKSSPLVSRMLFGIQGGDGGGVSEAVGAGAWDLVGKGEAEGVRAEDVGVEAGVAGVHLGGDFWDEVEGEEDGVGVVVRVPGVEQEVGVWYEDGEGIGGGVEHVGAEGGLRGGALAVAGAEQSPEGVRDLSERIEIESLALNINHKLHSQRHLPHWMCPWERGWGASSGPVGPLEPAHRAPVHPGEAGEGLEEMSFADLQPECRTPHRLLSSLSAPEAVAMAPGNQESSAVSRWMSSTRRPHGATTTLAPTSKVQRSSSERPRGPPVPLLQGTKALDEPRRPSCEAPPSTAIKARGIWFSGPRPPRGGQNCGGPLGGVCCHRGGFFTGRNSGFLPVSSRGVQGKNWGS
ncbi:hypothetical protein FQN60_007966 [Etheostoma spectabile]|uniref:Uncharacterized protein n=1 Tax=Etheostoma spectabile TaxID=54343 RepID=A0A5J5CXY1_9PERO|nr:hypothetical protein FQN60_007966 [Etheostoma spectabile]